MLIKTNVARKANLLELHNIYVVKGIGNSGIRGRWLSCYVVLEFKLLKNLTNVPFPTLFLTPFVSKFYEKFTLLLQ